MCNECRLAVKGSDATPLTAIRTCSIYTPATSNMCSASTYNPRTIIIGIHPLAVKTDVLYLQLKAVGELTGVPLSLNFHPSHGPTHRLCCLMTFIVGTPRYCVTLVYPNYIGQVVLLCHNSVTLEFKLAMMSL